MQPHICISRRVDAMIRQSRLANQARTSGVMSAVAMGPGVWP